MGLHHQSNHGRVLHGVEAKNYLAKHKRDSHGTNIKLNVPAYVKAAARPADAAQLNYGNKVAEVQTIESVVYVTMSADFTGATAGYTTLTDITPTSTAAASTTASTSTTAANSTGTNDAEASYISAKSAASARGSTAVSSTITVSPTSAAATTASSSASSSINNKSLFLNAPASAASTTAAAATLASASVQTAVVGAGVQATRAASSANVMTGGAKAGLAIGILAVFALAGGLLFFCWRRRKNPASHEEILDEKRAMSEKRASDSSGSSSHAASTAPRLSLRPVTQFLPAMANNRKSSGSAVDGASEKPRSMWERRANPAENPFGDAAASTEPQNPFDEPEGTEAATPKSDASAAAVTPAAPAKDVHRVQLDFKPSMEDELELKSGQLVRMLHEYDDGWALCIRMDRSQQGVAPRTCLSKLPVKPRPQSPTSITTDARPMTPTGPPGMVPRPLTPTTPTGTVVPTRKPVPGQAI